MASPRKEPLRKNEPSAKSLEELMELLLKLNSKLRRKISPRPKNVKAGDPEMVIIILNSPPEPVVRRPSPSRPEPARAPKSTWMDDLFQDLERGSE